MERIVIFDLGNVILNFDLGLFTGKLAALSGCSREELHAFAFGTPLDKSFDRGDISPEEFYRALTDRFSLAVPYEQFKQIFSEIFTPTPGTTELVEMLSNNYPLAILSNTNPLHFCHIKETYPVLQLFGAYYLSYELRLLKPDPRIYERVISACKCPPESIFYIDDLQPNVDGALRAGMQAVRFQSAEQLARDMKAGGLVA